MITEIKFYKTEENRWYADLPEYIEAGGSVEECKMVAGADQWLDVISNYGDQITLKLSSTDILQEKIELMSEPNYSEEGGTYLARTYKENDYNVQLWLCPVTLFVFGEYPQTIYYEMVLHKI